MCYSKSDTSDCLSSSLSTGKHRGQTLVNTMADGKEVVRSNRREAKAQPHWLFLATGDTGSGSCM